MTERKPTCVACKGAGGGANYTAGEGIKIESNEISADTTVLQSKLTAGTGITIDVDNIISATGGDWIEDTSYEWSKFANNDVTLKDLLFVVYTTYASTTGIYNAVLIKRGQSIASTYEINLPKRYADGNELTLLTTIKLNEIVKDIAATGVKARNTIISATIVDGNIVFQSGTAGTTYNISRSNVKLYYKN